MYIQLKWHIIIAQYVTHLQNSVGLSVTVVLMFSSRGLLESHDSSADLVHMAATHAHAAACRRPASVTECPQLQVGIH